MKRRVLSLTMAFLLAFTMLPTQAAAEELPEYEEVVEENVPEEEAPEEKSLETESLEAEELAAEAENTEGTVLTEETEETEETVTEAEPAEEVTEAPAAEETEEPEVKEEVPAEKEEASEAPEKETKPADAEETTEAVTETAPVQETEAPAEEIQSEEQNVSVQAMEANGVAVQAEDDDEGTTVTPCETHTFENGVCTVCQYKCTHEKATGTECPDCGITWCIKDDKGTKYTSFGDALENAPADSTLTLLDNVDKWANYNIEKNFTIDTDTYKITVYNIYIKSGVTLTLKGNGYIDRTIDVSSEGMLKLSSDWTGTINEVYLANSRPGFDMESGIVKVLSLGTSGEYDTVHISGGVFERISNKLSYRTDNIPVKNLLKSGYVFRQNNQTIEYTGEVPGWGALSNLTVEKCEEHRAKDGNNYCDYCNQLKTFSVELAAKDGSTANYSGLQGAFNEAQDGATVKLLDNISVGTQDSAYTVDKKRITLDLNDKTISGSGISVTNGADLTITGNGTVNGELTFDSNSTGQLLSGIFKKITSADKTLQELLPEKYAYRESNGNTWKSDIKESSIENVVVLPAPIQQLTITNAIGELTYGYSENKAQSIQVNPVLSEGYLENEVRYEWHKVDENGTESSDLASDKQTFYIPVGLEAGKHTYRVHATYQGYTLKADVTFKVSKAESTMTTTPTAQKLTYTGKDQQLITAGTTSDGTMVYSLEKEGTYTSNIPTGNAVQEYTVWYKVKGNSNHNDSEPASVTATISYFTTDAVATLADTNKGKNDWYTGTVTVQAPAGYTISSTLDGTYAASFTTDVSGENTYYLRQNDSGYITDAKTIPVKIDTDRPVAGKISMSTHYQVGWNLSKDDIQITQPVEDNTSGPDHIAYTLRTVIGEEGTIGTNPTSGTAEVDADGNAIITISKKFKGTINITSYDKAGNVGDTITYEKIAAEDEAPGLKLIDSFTEDWYTTVQTVRVSAQDTFSGLYKITYTVDGGEEQTLFEAKTNYYDPMVTDKKEVSFQAQDGTHTYAITAMDNAWNSTTTEITIHQDTQAPTKPTLTIEEAATDTTVTLQAAAEDETSGVKEYILWEAFGKLRERKSQDGVFALTGLTSDTEYVFTVTAKDNAGNISGVSDTFVVKTRKIPFASAVVTLKNADKIYNGTAQTPDVEVSMNGTVLAADQYVVNYEQDGAVVAAPTKAGTYKVVVTASENGDYEGTSSAQPDYTIAKKTITASLNGTLTKTYDGTTKVLEAQKVGVLLNGVEDGDEVTATADAYVYNSAEVKDADTITGSGIALAGVDAENYQLAETKVSVSAKILPKDLAKTEVTLGAALVANGKTQTQAVEKVMLDGTELTAQDYELTGNQAAAAGSYTLTIEGKNNYTGKIQKTYVVVPAAEQMVSDGNGDVKIGEGIVKVSVSAGQDAPEISLVSDKKTLIKMLIQGGNLTADEIVLIAEGATIELALNVEHAEASVSADTKEAMEKTAGEFTIGRYLNITFTKSVNGEDETEIHEINAPIKISFRLSDDLLNTDSKVKREYMVLRNHDGEVTTLPGIFADGIITFETDRFSDYAIAWKDTAVSTSGSKKKHRSGSSQQEETAVAATEVSQLVQAQGAPTGDTSPTEWMLLLAALSAAGIGMTLARKCREY